MTPVLEASGIEVERGGRVVASAERVALDEGETLALLGPNGAGKTSLVLALATLIPARGEIRHRGAVVADLVAFRRRTAVVFQRPLLLDRSVIDNAALGLEIRGAPTRDRRARAAAALERFGVAHLADRPAVALSGGEAQRVSLARAFAVDPEVLFLDEPFGALDAPTRAAVIADLARALREARVATVLVTHDRDEALTLADRVAVMIGGRVRQVGGTEAVFGTPVDAEIAEFVGVENVLPSRVESVTEERTVLRVGQRLVEAAAMPPEGEDAPLVLIAPDAVVIAQAAAFGSSARNSFAGRVGAVEPIGRQVRLVVDCGFRLVAHVTRQSAREMRFAPGDEVVASFKATSVHLIRRHRA